MKIVLSRKGFDSQSGGMPNPILPDGTLLALPIPSEGGNVKYNDLVYGEKTYLDIIQELNSNIASKLLNTYCHVDPDLNNCYRNPVNKWKPAFGQSNLSEKHLEKQKIGKGDIFLFYGWFRQTEYDKKGKLRFVRKLTDNANTIDKHVIYGYMEVGEKLSDSQQILERYSFHPHAQKKYINLPDNALYIPVDHLSIDKQIKGYGWLNYQPIRQLTKERHKRSEWALPDCFKTIPITYHEKPGYGWVQENDYFKSAYRGQEFVLEANEEILRWVKEVITGEKEDGDIG
jgi:hypothetical protein